MKRQSPEKDTDARADLDQDLTNALGQRSEERTAALQESERRLRTAMKIANLGYYIWDLVEDRCVYCSEEYAAIHGTSVEEYSSTVLNLEDDSQLVHPEDRDRYIAAVNDLLLHSKPLDLEYRILGKDGQVRYVRDVEIITEIRDGTPVRTEGTLQDITESKQAEKNLRDSRDHMRLIADNVRAFINYCDTEQRFRFVNQTAQEWLARPEEEILGRTIREIIGPEAHDQLSARLEEVLLGKEMRFEQPRTYPDGVPRVVEISYVPHRSETGEVQGFFALVHDVTERKRTEKEIRSLNEDLERRVLDRTEDLRQSELRLREIMETLPAAFALYDHEDRLAMCNETYRRYGFYDRDSIPYGCTFEEILKYKLSQGHFPDADGREAEWLAERLRVHFDTPGPIEQRQNNGRWYWINERRISEGSIVAVSMDITERKTLEENLLRQERLATLGRLTATVGHELRNPLGTIRTSAYVLRTGLSNQESRFQRSLERIDRNIERCDRIIDELLDLTRVSQIALESTPVDALVNETLDEQTLPAEVSLHRELGLAGVTARLDRDRFRRAIINVFDNGCQAMSGTDTGSNEKVLCVRTRQNDGRVELIFEDTGPGIPPDDYGKIFEPLYSTKNFGVGLGLPVVKQIMEQHGGGVEIKSEEGCGTKVCLWLPLERSTR